MSGNKKVHVAVDYGTTTLSVAAWVTTDGKPPSKVYGIPLHGSSGWASPQIVAYHDSKFYWGHTLKSLLFEKKVPQECVIRMLKLYLYPEFRNGNLGKVIRKQLSKAKKHDYEVIGQHLKEILKSVKPWLKTRRAFISLTPEEINIMEVELLLLVPACWDTAGTGTMTAAAHVAGVKRCQIVTESRVAICALDKEDYIGPTGPMTLLTVDGGGGTLDCASSDLRYVRKDDSKDVLENPISRTPHYLPRSSLLGSQMVDENFFNFILGPGPGYESQCPEILDAGGIDAFLATYLATSFDLRTQLAPLFKDVKESFDSDKERIPSFMLTFPDHPEPDKRLVFVKLNVEQVKDFFEPIIKGWLEELSNMCTENTKLILLSGGFSHNAYLQDRLNERFMPAVRIECPEEVYEVSKHHLSADVRRLFRHVVPLPLPHGLSWGIVGNEEYDERYHSHCVVNPRDYGRRGEPHFNRKHTHRLIDEDGSPAVYAANCVDYLITPDTEPVGPNQLFRKAIKTLIHNVAEDEAFIEVDVVRTGRLAIQHEPLWDTYGNPQEGLALVDPLPVFYLPDLEGLGYSSGYDTKGTKWFCGVRVDYFLEVHPEEVKLRLRVTHSEDVYSTNPSRPFWEQEQIIWSMWLSNVVRDKVDQPQSGGQSDDRSGTTPSTMASNFASTRPTSFTSTHPSISDKRAARTQAGSTRISQPKRKRALLSDSEYADDDDDAPETKEEFFSQKEMRGLKKMGNPHHKHHKTGSQPRSKR